MSGAGGAAWPGVAQWADEVRRFEDQQRQRCAAIGIDVAGMTVSHVAWRCRTWADYVAARAALESVAVANNENVWNGRPISKIVLREPVALTGSRPVELVELIAPPHQRVYRMGLEHIGYVVGVEPFAAFVEEYFGELTGQQFQSRRCKPVYRLFEDFTHVKFYEESLRSVCESEGARFDVTTHVDWAPSDPLAGPYEL